jgi:tetratricopeptide (TPR) repeat protein
LSSLAFSLRAQAVSPATCSDEAIWTDIVGAERLYWEAIRALDQADEAERAALLFGQSASLRVRCDPQALPLIRMSALLYQRAGNLQEGQRTMYRAAELAARTGQLLAAAHAYLDYAVLSHELGDTQAAVDAATKAELISRLPALSEWARSTIRDRMEWKQTAVIPSAS